MDEWCTNTHSKSGLTKLVQESTLNIKDAEQIMIDYAQRHGLKLGQSILAGNSIHVDKQFMLKEMPTFCQYLHYRLIDVSTIKELVKRWYPALPTFVKKETHRALDDIKESISELQYYQKSVFK